MLSAISFFQRRSHMGEGKAGRGSFKVNSKPFAAEGFKRSLNSKSQAPNYK
jgi:hypothetical protein